MTKLPILVFGSSGHASVVIDSIERQQSYEIAGLVDSFKPAGTVILGYEVLGTEAELAGITRDRRVFGIVIAIGDNWQRARIAAHIRAAAPELQIVSAVHPGAEVSRSVEIGAGSVVMAGAVINRNARIGPFCIVNTKASVDHDSSLAEFSERRARSHPGGQRARRRIHRSLPSGSGGGEVFDRGSFSNRRRQCGAERPAGSRSRLRRPRPRNPHEKRRRALRPLKAAAWLPRKDVLRPSRHQRREAERSAKTK